MSKVKGAGPDYRDTVFLPRTDFPMKGDLPRREPEILARWERTRLWDRTQAGMKGRPPFVLHDGPIYSNGNIHIGHALNRILKDVVMRAHRMAGEDADFVPGWDTHGLPIEWMVEEEYRKAKRDKDAVPVLQFREECRRYSQRFLDIQREEFIRLGVTGDWARRYATMDFPSEAAIAAEIGRFLINGSLYRGLRPVMWSPVEKTALADAEVEYHERTSDTVYVRCRILDGDLAGASAVYWTTTPWTAPGTRALSIGPDIDYAVLRVDAVREGSHAVVGERLLVARDLADEFAQAVGITARTEERRLTGKELIGLHVRHPLATHPDADALYAKPMPFLEADYITSDQGTGFVPCAPAHGEEDFEVGRRAGLEILDTVAPDGTLYPWTGPVGGVHVFKSGGPVSAELDKAGSLLGRGTLRHSYPHSWRSKAPVIYRATAQWFIRMDGPEQIRAKAMRAVDETVWVPSGGRNRMAAMVANRPDWCISRQRVWGVPIPVFVERRTGEPLRDPAVLQRVVDVFAEEGADAWYSSPPSRFLGNERDPEDYEQVTDIVDVWFESGSTHAFVLEERGIAWPADLYLEGTDQHRGWFQHSLLEAIGTRGAAPFKAVLTHGFVLDEHGRKMSKSVGNVTAPQEVTDKLGADILRLWVVNSDVNEDLRIGPEILKQQAELYRRLRNTFRWLLGNLAGFDETERVDPADMPELERWVLHRLTDIDTRMRGALASHDWTGVYPELHHFCATDLSAFYFDVRKDALYCDAPDSLRRRAARTVLDLLHRHLCCWLAPVLCFTAEEAWLARFPSPDGSVHLQLFPDVPASWRDDALAARWERVREIRRETFEALETGRRAGEWGSSLGAEATLAFAPGADPLLSEADWADVLIVSEVGLARDEAGPRARVGKASGLKCERCWRVLAETGTGRHAGVCLRCDAVVSARDPERQLQPA